MISILCKQVNDIYWITCWLLRFWINLLMLIKKLIIYNWKLNNDVYKQHRHSWIKKKNQGQYISSEINSKPVLSTLHPKLKSANITWSRPKQKYQNIKISKHFVIINFWWSKIIKLNLFWLLQTGHQFSVPLSLTLSNFHMN